MAKLKIAIIGADGQLSFDLMRVFEPHNEIIKFTRKDFDITDQAKTLAKISDAKPNFIINTAAFHKVEECELNPDKTFQINSLGAYYVAQAAARNNSAVIYISTDYVFGDEKESYDELDKPDPLNVYGASKLAGEILTKIANPSCYIVRTSALFGVHQSGKGHNFITLMFKLASENQEIKVVNDQFTSPTYTFDLANKIKEIIEKPAPFGIYHITNQGSCSWYEFAEKIFELKGLTPNFKAIKATDQISRLKRPKSTILENRAIKKLGLKPMRPWPEALKAHLEELSKKGL